MEIKYYMPSKLVDNPRKTIIGMIHVQALPGTPLHKMAIGNIIEQAVEEAKVYEQNDVDAIMLENMHDIPYLNRNVGPEIVAAMTAVCVAVKNAVDLPIGLQILAGANQAALAVALAADLNFIRAEAFVFSHVADEGWMDGCAGSLLRYRKQIGAEQIQIFTDIKKKHSSHAITGDLTIAEQSHAAEFFLSEGIIVTGVSTGEPVLKKELLRVREKVALPLLIGSGITIDNIKEYWKLADAFIVGSYFKQMGNWKNPVDGNRVEHFMQVITQLRENE